MRLDALSFRQKMLLPAVIGAVATLAATGVMLLRMRGAADRLVRLETRDVSTLKMAQDMEVKLTQLQRQLQDAAAGEDLSLLDAADDLRVELDDFVKVDGAPLIPKARADRLLAAIEAYYGIARPTTLRLIRQDRGEGMADALRRMTANYNTLREELAQETRHARADMTEGFATTRQIQQGAVLTGAALLVAAALGAGLLGWWLARATARPLEALNAAALRIAQGDLSQEVEVSGNDEIGMLAASFQRMRGRLRDIVATLKQTSHDLGGAADRLSELTRSQGAFLERQATGVTETSTTTRELEQASSVAATRAASVLEVARRAAQMSDSGHEAAERSVDGLRQIQGTVESIVTQSSRLLEQARQVGDIVETVRDLATQSHVLSLNASIEAARAGEAGRGFAVVAAEVRALAEQSGQSAARIGKIVQDILGAIQSTLEMTERGNRGMEGSLSQVRASGESLREIGGIVRETSDAALHIASAVQQQSQGIAQIAGAMRDLDKGMEETLGQIATLESAASQIAENAARISTIADGFRT